jgi:hypothetical protein
MGDTGKLHELKCWPPYFGDVLAGRKTFELRRNDRDFKVGDLIDLKEYDHTHEDGPYTGRTCLVEVAYALEGYGLEPGYIALGLKAVEDAA